MLRKFVVSIMALMLLVIVIPGLALAEEGGKVVSTIVELQMTISQLSEKNHLPLEKVLTVLDNKTITPETTVMVAIEQKNMPLETLTQKIHDLQVETNLEGSKDWFKIKMKFLFWALFIIAGMVLLAKESKNIKVTPIRKFFLVAAVLVFGIWLGSDPNPVGTINDAIVLYGKEGVIFKPRLMALSVFLLTVVLGGRMLCGWGCQLGTLQEVIYQSPLPKYRIPFKISQSIRVIFFITMSILALAWGFDLIGMADPFKIFALKPLVFWGSTIIISIILLLSLFIYRPWCQILCPFGLVAFFTEKISWFRILVNKDKCVDCGSCYRVCPTGAIEAKHSNQQKIDCYNCGECIDKCPVRAIVYDYTIRK